MARAAAYIFCRYQILDQNEKPLSAREEFEVFEEVTGQPIAYRVREPKPGDHNTYLMKARQKKISSYTVHTWEIAQDIKFREATKGTIVNADEASSWDGLHDRFEMKRINHEEAYSMDGACTNWAEEFFSRMRRAEIGHHHHIAGAYLLRYAQEASWREDNRRTSNGEQMNRLAGLAMKRGKSIDFSGYW